MVKILMLCVLLLLIALPVALCKTAKDRAATKAARKDARYFKLDKQLWKQFRHKRFAPTSDYFKPNPADVSDTSLLKDSTYVTAYRLKAYKRTLHRHTAGHYLLIYGGVTIGAIIITLTIIVISLSGSDFI